MSNRRRRSPEKIIRKLAEGQKLLGSGKTVEEVCHEFGIAESVGDQRKSRFRINESRGAGVGVFLGG